MSLEDGDGGTTTPPAGGSPASEGSGTRMVPSMSQEAFDRINADARHRGQSQGRRALIDELGFADVDALKEALKSNKTQADRITELETQAQSLTEQLAQQKQNWQGSSLERQAKELMKGKFVEAAEEDVLSILRAQIGELEFDEESFTFSGVDELLNKIAEDKPFMVAKASDFQSPTAPPSSGSPSEAPPAQPISQGRSFQVKF